MMSVPFALYAGKVTNNFSNSNIGDYPGQPIGKNYIKYDYTGEIDSFIVPYGVYSLDLECYGAGLTGKGGYISGKYYCNPGQKLYIVVGGANGFNGGGDTVPPTNRIMFNSNNSVNGIPYSKGSGASDIRLIKADLNSRILTAGGSGSAWNGNPNNMYGVTPYATGGAGGSIILSPYAAAGGNGQTTHFCNGNPGISTECATSGGGTITMGGVKACVPFDAWAGVDCNLITDGGFGFGGNGQVGGGGGYYGGGGATMGAYYSGQTKLASGGGSSYANPSFINFPIQIIGGINHGEGKIIISW
jgi:hypothetical protein